MSSLNSPIGKDDRSPIPVTFLSDREEMQLPLPVIIMGDETASRMKATGDPGTIPQTGGGGAISGVMDTIIKSFSSLGSTFEKIASVVQDVVDGFEMVETAMTVASEGATVFGSVLAGITVAYEVAKMGIRKFNEALASIAHYVDQISPAAVVRLDYAYKDLDATIGAKLVPILIAGTEVVERFADAIAGINLTNGVQAISGVVRQVGGAVVAVMNSVIPIVEDILKFLAPAISFIGDAIAGVVPVVKFFIETIATIGSVIPAVVEVISSVASVLGVVLVPIFNVFGTVLQAFGSIIRGVVDFVVIAVRIELSASADFAGMVMLHKSVVDSNNVATMQDVSSIDIPAGQTVTLQPGGFHIMFMNLQIHTAGWNQSRTDSCFSKSRDDQCSSRCDK